MLAGGRIATVFSFSAGNDVHECAHVPRWIRQGKRRLSCVHGYRGDGMRTC
jgi:hypothetical protein